MMGFFSLHKERDSILIAPNIQISTISSILIPLFMWKKFSDGYIQHKVFALGMFFIPIDLIFISKEKYDFGRNVNVESLCCIAEHNTVYFDCILIQQIKRSMVYISVLL